jgi:hypothetical protein
MTERSEVTFMIDTLQDVLDEVKYEAATRPGEGPAFEAKLILAAGLLDAAIEKLKEAEAMLPNTEGTPP